MLLLIQYTLIFASVLILVALGGALMMKYMPEGASPFVLIICTVLMAIIAGVVYSSLLAVACINFKADQTIIGTALNLLGVAAATVIVKAINTAENPDNVSSEIQYIAQKKAFLVEKNMPAEQLLKVFEQATQERSKGIQVNISVMKKNKKFQKEQLTAEGYTEIQEFFKDRM